MLKLAIFILLCCIFKMNKKTIKKYIVKHMFLLYNIFYQGGMYESKQIRNNFKFI